MTNLADLAYIRAGAAVNKIEIANPSYNSKEILKLILKAGEENVQILVFPELCLTGYTCADLFHQKFLIDEAEKELHNLLKQSSSLNMVIAVGIPVRSDNQMFNCAVVFYKGQILGAVPKTYIPNYNEYYEKRWFSSSLNRINSYVTLCDQQIPFHENLLFKDKNSELCMGIELCEDLWAVIPPSSYHAMYGANIILNLSASNELIGKSEYRRSLVEQQSARCMAAYVYASAGQSESTTDVVFGGHTLIAENGMILEDNRFPDDSAFVFHDIDLDRLTNDRKKFNSFMGKIEKKEYNTVSFSLDKNTTQKLKRNVDAYPFVPNLEYERNIRCKEIFKIQSAGLAQRLDKTGVKKAVVGISGGVDSTLALLVCVEAFKCLSLPAEDILCITMPGFGTTGRTYNNALNIAKELGVALREISIKEASLQHFKDIGHDPEIYDVTYENVQARERTQILMDIANKEGGLVIGTGDLSELALGWATYNGDHMSMYAVNTSIPKTLVRYLLKWYADTTNNKNIACALIDIGDTPVSPELLPPDKEGKIQQKTESIIGSYELHDFFLYNMLRFGYTPKKIFFLAQTAFRDKYDAETILHWLKVFYKRFFTQQFKRSCMPDGPKVGSVNLSPRGDWRMPSDASCGIWLKELDGLEASKI